jgi:hypothetical protein
MPVSIDDLKQTLLVLESNFDAAYELAETAEAKQDLRLTLAAARDAFWKATANGLEDENEFVLSLSEDLKAQNRKLQGMANSLTDVVAFLKAAKESVKLAAAIATLAAAA